MQQTRQQILAIVRDKGEVTVDQLVMLLSEIRGSITHVTVRHHLAKLQDDGLLHVEERRHREAPGRPQHVFSLTPRGADQFPNNYRELVKNLLQEIKETLPQEQVNVIFEGVADKFASQLSIPAGPLTERLNIVVDFLNEHGYQAHWEATNGGFLLHTSNCPYHQVNDDHTLCQMDMRLMSRLLGITPRLVKHVAEGDPTCSYYVPENVF
jgi:predicted ArsR family transcriptional regulator